MVELLIESDRDEVIYIITKILAANGLGTTIPKEVASEINISDAKFSRDASKIQS